MHQIRKVAAVQGEVFNLTCANDFLQVRVRLAHHDSLSLNSDFLLNAGNAERNVLDDVGVDGDSNMLHVGGRESVQLGPQRVFAGLNAGNPEVAPVVADHNHLGAKKGRARRRDGDSGENRAPTVPDVAAQGRSCLCQSLPRET